MAQELDIFQDTAAAEDAFADSTMQAEQSASDCPEGFSYNEELGACVADDFKFDPGWYADQSPFGIDLRALYENRPPPVIQGEDGQMYRNFSYLTAGGWITEPDYDTPVYFFHQPLELGDPREIYYTLNEDGRLESQFGSWWTEEQIKAKWDADEGMGAFKKANPDLDFGTWFSFIKDASALSASGLNRNDNPEEFEALVNQYGISTFYQNNDGDIFEWNGSSFTKTYKVDDSFPIGDIIMSVAIGYMTAGVLGPGGAFGSSGLFGGGAAGGAASGAIGSTIAQGVINGKIDPTAVVTAGVLGGINGFFNELTTGELGIAQDAAGNTVYTINGEVMTGAQNLADTYIIKVANVLGIPYNEAAGIVQGVLNGTVSGEDLEGIAINAVGGWSEAKIKGFLTNTFGDGVNVDNWFREGDSFIPTEALFPFVETAIQGAIDGGVSKVDLLKMLGGYFKAGGDLDFILPGLPDLDLEGAFPDLGFDFCEEFPGFPGLCEDIDLNSPCNEGEILDSLGVCVSLDIANPCEEGQILNSMGVCEPINIGEITCPPTPVPNGQQLYKTTSLGECIPDVIECIEGFDLVGQECVKVDAPDTSCPRKEIANGVQTYVWDQNLGECVPDVIECIEGFDLVGQECVKVSGGTFDFCSEPRPEEYGYAQINWDKYCKVPEINCPDGKEYNTELGECVDIKVPKTTCPDGFRDEEGECVKIDLPSVNVDLPSVSLGQPGSGMFTPKDPMGLSYEQQTPTPLVQSSPVDAMAGITSFINRKLNEKPSDQDISSAFNSDPDKGLFT